MSNLSTEKWVCVRCKTPNYVMRTTCHECGMTRTKVLFNREPETKLESDDLVEVAK